MLCPCKFQNCVVCHNLREMEILKSIFEENSPETKMLCRQAMYQITNADGAGFILPTLDGVTKGQNGYYVHDMCTPNIIYLNRNNLKILCSQEGECTKTLSCG